MKALTLMLLLLAAFTLQANASLPNLCQPLQKKVKVQYTINTSFSVGEKHQQQLTLWRTPQKVAHQYPTKLITQQWTRANNGRLSRTQYFDQDLRAIEFEIQSPQTSTDAHWQKKFQLVTNQLINSMNLVTTQGQACDLVKYYHLEKNHKLSCTQNLIEYHSTSRNERRIAHFTSTRTPKKESAMKCKCFSITPQFLF